MIYTYKFADGTTNESEVTDKIAAELKELDRIEYNNNQAETRRHASLEAFNLDDGLFVADVDIEADVFRSIELKTAMFKLTKRHQYLIRKIQIEGWTLSEIARFEGKNKSVIYRAYERAEKNLKKFYLMGNINPLP